MNTIQILVTVYAIGAFVTPFVIAYLHARECTGDLLVFGSIGWPLLVFYHVFTRALSRVAALGQRRRDRIDRRKREREEAEREVESVLQ
jgi:hypothetical protein